MRRLGLADLPAVLSLQGRAPELQAWSAAGWGTMLQPTVPRAVLRYCLYGAEEDRGALVAVLAGHLLAETADLELLLVDPRCRRQGTGRLLVQRWLRWAARLGAREALLEVRASNKAAHQLYTGLGFTQVSRRAGYYAAPVEDALVLRYAMLRRAGRGESVEPAGL